MKKDKPRVIVIGLDGATFTNLKPWMDEGLLPNLKFLVDNGASGELESTIPRLSSPAWVSFMTGVNPGKHGVFGFVKPFKDKSYKKELITSADIKVKTIFEILSDHEKCSGVINLPMTYPPFKINGFIIGCGLTTPSTDFDFTYPRDLFEKYGLERNNYMLTLSIRDYPENEREKFFIDLIDCSQKRKEVAFKLLEKFDWDLFVLVFGGTDRLQHFFWHCMDKTHPKYNEKDEKKFLPHIIKYYQKLDSIIGDFITRVDENTSLFIVSDHGFGPLEKYISTHRILQEHGFLCHNNKSLLEKIREFQYKFRAFLHKNSAIYRKIAKPIYHKLFKKEISENKIKERLGAGDDDYWRTINWKKTFAYLGNTENALYLNLKGREPEGVVNSDKEYREIRDQITRLISDIYEPMSKTKPTVKVYKKDEIFTGPYAKYAPDLYFELDGSRYVLWYTTETNSQEIFRESPRTGNHTKDGVVIAYGKNIQAGKRVTGANIMDIAPTILYMLGVPVSEDMDGKVLKDIFKPNYKDSGDVACEKYSEREKTSYTEEDTSMVEKRLKDLGYL